MRNIWWLLVGPILLISSGCGSVQSVPVKSGVAAIELREAWRFDTGGFVDASPVVVGGRVYAASWDGFVYALDEQGELLWKRDLGGEIDATPVASSGLLFVQTWQRQAFALDLESGAVRWQFTYPESPADDHRQGALLPVGDMVLLPGWGGDLYALKRETGELVWQYPGQIPLRAAPVTDQDSIYLNSGNGVFTVLDMDGNRQWSYDFGEPLLSRAALTPHGPVVLSRDGQLVAFSRQGQVRWRRSLQELCYYSAPVYLDGVLYLATAAGRLSKISADTGEDIWVKKGLGAFYGTPLLAPPLLIVGNNQGQLYLVDSERGTLLGSYQASRDIQSTPAFFNGRLLFGSRDGSLTALEMLLESH